MTHNFEVKRIIENALNEDIGYSDITTDNIIGEFATSEAKIIAKQDGIIAGMKVFQQVFEIIDETVQFNSNFKDGDKVKSGDIISVITGKTRSLLKAERTALNILQRLSGIATRTRTFCDAVKDYEVRIVDTRKTTPGIRVLEKYAVRMGGGFNHRYCLSDAVLIKDNHIKAAGGITNAVSAVRKNISHTIKIEVETETLEQVVEAVAVGTDIIMLDNMKIDQMKKAVELINKRAIVEASGNISLNNVVEVAGTGVDIISVGSLTHSVSSLDISMRIM